VATAVARDVDAWTPLSSTNATWKAITELSLSAAPQPIGPMDRRRAVPGKARDHRVTGGAPALNDFKVSVNE
jgi:hypothetical protein